MDIAVPISAVCILLTGAVGGAYRYANAIGKSSREETEKVREQMLACNKEISYQLGKMSAMLYRLVGQVEEDGG